MCDLSIVARVDSEPMVCGWWMGRLMVATPRPIELLPRYVATDFQAALRFPSTFKLLSSYFQVSTLKLLSI